MGLLEGTHCLRKSGCHAPTPVCRVGGVRGVRVTNDDRVQGPLFGVLEGYVGWGRRAEGRHFHAILDVEAILLPAEPQSVITRSGELLADYVDH